MSDVENNCINTISTWMDGIEHYLCDLYCVSFKYLIAMKYLG